MSDIDFDAATRTSPQRDSQVGVQSVACKGSTRSHKERAPCATNLVQTRRTAARARLSTLTAVPARLPHVNAPTAGSKSRKTVNELTTYLGTRLWRHLLFQGGRPDQLSEVGVDLCLLGGRHGLRSCCRRHCRCCSSDRCTKRKYYGTRKRCDRAYQRPHLRLASRGAFSRPCAQRHLRQPKTAPAQQVRYKQGHQIAGACTHTPTWNFLNRGSRKMAARCVSVMS